MSEAFSTLANVFTLTFVVTSMFTFGLRLTFQQMVEPLRNPRLVITARLVNFGIVPLTAVGLVRLFSLDRDLTTELVLMSLAAGALMIPKLTQIAHGNIRVAVSLVALLVIAAVIFMPLVLPLVLPDVVVNAGSIAATLGVLILLSGLVSLVVVLCLRGRTKVGATLVEVLTHYADQLQEVNGRQYLTGISHAVYDQIVRTGKLRLTGPVRVYEATSVRGQSTEEAVADARTWLIRSVSRSDAEQSG